MEMISSLSISRPGGPTATVALTLGLFLSIFSNFDHTVIVAPHAIYTLASLCKDKLVDSVLAYFTFEAMGMVRIVASHDSFIENGEVADVAVVRTVGANGRAIGK